MAHSFWSHFSEMLRLSFYFISGSLWTSKFSLSALSCCAMCCPHRVILPKWVTCFLLPAASDWLSLTLTGRPLTLIRVPFLVAPQQWQGLLAVGGSVLATSSPNHWWFIVSCVADIRTLLLFFSLEQETSHTASIIPFPSPSPYFSHTFPVGILDHVSQLA